MGNTADSAVFRVKGNLKLLAKYYRIKGENRLHYALASIK